MRRFLPYAASARYARSLFFFNDAATPEIYTLSLHDALPISGRQALRHGARADRSLAQDPRADDRRSEEHTSELQSLRHLVCRLLLEKKNKPGPRHPVYVAI